MLEQTWHRVHAAVYVAQVCYGANPAQTLKAFVEAESYDGPALVIAYSPCVEHGFDMARTGEGSELRLQLDHFRTVEELAVVQHLADRLVDAGP